VHSTTSMNTEMPHSTAIDFKYTARAWVVTLTASLFFFYEFIQLNLFNAINGDLMQAFHLNALQLGQLASMYFYANALCLFPAGMLLDRYSARKILLFAMTLATVGTFLFGFADTLKTAAIGRFIVGIGAAFCFLSCIRVASRWFPPHKMALATGVIVTMAMLGGLVAQTPLAFLSHWLGWRNAILIDGILGIVLGLIIFLFLEDRPPGRQNDAIADKVQLKKLGFWQAIRLVLFNKYNWFGGLYTSLLNLPVFLLGALWGIEYLVQVHHITAVQASYATTCFFLGVIVGSPSFGWFSDYIGRRVMPMIVGAILSAIVLSILLFISHFSLSQLIFLFFLIGFVTSSQVLSYPAIAELNPIILTGTAISIESMIIMISGAIIQPFFGWLIELRGDHAIVDGVHHYAASDFLRALIVLPIACVMGLFIALFIKETYCKSQA